MYYFASPRNDAYTFKGCVVLPSSPPRLSLSLSLCPVLTARCIDRRNVSLDSRRVVGGTAAIRRPGSTVDAGHAARHRHAGTTRRVRVHARVGRQWSVPRAAAVREQHRPRQGRVRHRPPGAVQKDEEAVRGENGEDCKYDHAQHAAAGARYDTRRVALLIKKKCSRLRTDGGFSPQELLLFFFCSSCYYLRPPFLSSS